jgi:LuxR family quorum-sensing system transcriptional regulator SolR
MDVPTTVVFDGYPSGWMVHYKERDYVTVDPTISSGMQNSRLLVWTSALFAKASPLWADAQEAGLRVGAAQACWADIATFGLFSVARSSKKIDEVELGVLQTSLAWLATNMHQRMQRLMQRDSPPLVDLSVREREVLSWTADGKTAWEIGRILSVGESTVNFHIKNAMSKLGARNKVQAAVIAVSMGLLMGPWQASRSLCISEAS